MIAAHRLPDWMTRLSDLVVSRMHMPFAWGAHDCCLWAADTVRAVTGVDPMADLRGSYDSEIGAARVLVRLGRNLGQIVGDRLGCETLVTLAQPGDVGLAIQADGMPALVSNVGAHWLGAGVQGLVGVDPADIRVAWRCVGGEPCRQ